METSERFPQIAFSPGFEIRRMFSGFKSAWINPLIYKIYEIRRGKQRVVGKEKKTHPLFKINQSSEKLKGNRPQMGNFGSNHLQSLGEVCDIGGRKRGRQ